MQLRTVPLLLFATVLVGGCASGFKAMYDHDNSVDFSKYQTFAWISKNPMHTAEGAAVNPLLEPKIMAATESALGEKGYSKVDDPESADFVISFSVGSRDKIKVDSYSSMSAGYYGGAYPAHWRWGGAYYCCQSNTQVRQYTEGALAVDIFDGKERRPVWHSVASKTITDADRKNVDATVRSAVDAIVAGFPPQ